jgi:predicted transcriptional regulator
VLLLESGRVGLLAELEHDIDAVACGLTTRWSSGPVEGRVNHIKMLNGRCTAGPACRCCANGSCSPRQEAAVPASVHDDHATGRTDLRERHHGHG